MSYKVLAHPIGSVESPMAMSYLFVLHNKKKTYYNELNR